MAESGTKKAVTLRRLKSYEWVCTSCCSVIDGRSEGSACSEGEVCDECKRLYGCCEYHEGTNAPVHG